MKIGTNAEGLKLAIEHAFEELEKDKVDGFKYPIGKVKGQPIYIVWDNGKKNQDLIEFELGGMTFTAVYEDD